LIANISSPSIFIIMGQWELDSNASRQVSMSIQVTLTTTISGSTTSSICRLNSSQMVKSYTSGPLSKIWTMKKLRFTPSVARLRSDRLLKPKLSCFWEIPQWLMTPTRSQIVPGTTKTQRTPFMATPTCQWAMTPSTNYVQAKIIQTPMSPKAALPLLTLTTKLIARSNMMKASASSTVGIR